jgi:hypothetical protein
VEGGMMKNLDNSERDKILKKIEELDKELEALIYETNDIKVKFEIPKIRTGLFFIKQEIKKL